jgi:hypothetical protein
MNMTLHVLYTVELWNSEHLNRLLKTELRAANPRQALALALQYMKERGIPVHDNVKMLVKGSDDADVDSVVFSARDIRSWLKESEQADFTKESNLGGLIN